MVDVSVKILLIIAYIAGMATVGMVQLILKHYSLRSKVDVREKIAVKKGDEK